MDRFVDEVSQIPPPACQTLELAEKLDSTYQSPRDSLCTSPSPTTDNFPDNTQSQYSIMPHAPAKRQKREEYKNAMHADEQNTALPKKKFYRQRAHANPFSDHSLT